jgi:hypothetical protein
MENTEHMISKENSNVRTLAEVFNAAFFDCELKGELLTIRTPYKCLIEANAAFITFVIVFGLKPNLPRATAYEICNRINAQYKIPKVYVNDQVALLELVLVVGSGIPKRTVVESIRLMTEAIGATSEFKELVN